jgi:hypothetical protein
MPGYLESRLTVAMDTDAAKETPGGGPLLLTARGAASLSRLTPRQIGRLMDAGELDCLSVGSRRMVIRQSLEDLMCRLEGRMRRHGSAC